MKRLHGLTLLVCIGGFSPSFAADPPAGTGTPTAVAAQPALAPTPVAADPTVESTVAQPTPVAGNSLSATPQASAGTVDAAAAKAAAAAASEEKKFRSRGYRPQVRNGETYWCKSDMAVGSRLPTTTCSTAAQMELAEQQGQDTVKYMQMHDQMDPVRH